MWELHLHRAGGEKGGRRFYLLDEGKHCLVIQDGFVASSSVRGGVFMVLRAITVKGQHALHVFEKGGINISEGEGITKTKTGDRLTSPSVLVLEDGVDGDEVDRITMTHVPKQFCLSNVPAQQKAKLLRHAKSIGACVLEGWSSDCTHLVMGEAILTPKMLLALISGVPIVTPDYVEALMKLGPLSSSLPDPRDYLPPIKAKTADITEKQLKSMRPRRQMFRGIDFLFLDQGDYERVREVASAGGAHCELIFTEEALRKCVEVCREKQQVAVVVRPVRGDGESASSQNTSSQPSKNAAASKRGSKRGRRSTQTQSESRDSSILAALGEDCWWEEVYTALSSEKAELGDDILRGISWIEKTCITEAIVEGTCAVLFGGVAPEELQGTPTHTAEERKQLAVEEVDIAPDMKAAKEILSPPRKRKAAPSTENYDEESNGRDRKRKKKESLDDEQDNCSIIAEVEGNNEVPKERKRKGSLSGQATAKRRRVRETQQVDKSGEEVSQAILDGGKLGNMETKQTESAPEGTVEAISLDSENLEDTQVEKGCAGEERISVMETQSHRSGRKKSRRIRNVTAGIRKNKEGLSSHIQGPHPHVLSAPDDANQGVTETSSDPVHSVAENDVHNTSEKENEKMEVDIEKMQEFEMEVGGGAENDQDTPGTHEVNSESESLARIEDEAQETESFVNEDTDKWVSTTPYTLSAENSKPTSCTSAGGCLTAANLEKITQENVRPEKKQKLTSGSDVMRDSSPVAFIAKSDASISVVSDDDGDWIEPARPSDSESARKEMERLELLRNELEKERMLEKEAIAVAGEDFLDFEGQKRPSSKVRGGRRREASPVEEQRNEKAKKTVENVSLSPLPSVVVLSVKNTGGKKFRKRTTVPPAPQAPVKCIPTEAEITDAQRKVLGELQLVREKELELEREAGALFQENILDDRKKSKTARRKK